MVIRSGTSFALLLALTGCQGMIDDTPPLPGELLPPPEEPPPACEADDSCIAGPLRAPSLRPLNRREYRNTVRDLFGLSELPSLTLPMDTRSERNFDSDGVTSTFAVGDAELYFNAAEDVFAQVIAEDKVPFAQCADLADDALRGCIDEALPSWIEGAMRRPARTDVLAQTRMLLETDTTYEGAVRTVVVATLMSPFFVFHYKTPEEARSESGADAFETADRLAYFLWSSPPDAELLSLAREGALADADVVAAQAQRLLSDERAERFLRDFAVQWLSIDGFVESADTEEKRVLFADMREETIRFVVSVLGEDEPLARLLDSQYTVLNARLSEHYGIERPADAGEWARTTTPPERLGLLSHGSLAAARSPTGDTNPFARGAWVAEYFACTETPPPPEGAGELMQEEGATTIREQVEQHRSDPFCVTCHRSFDFYGLALEEFDAYGRYRSEYENGAPVRPEGQLPSGAEFATVSELALAMAAEDEFEHCLTELIGTYGLGRNIHGLHARDLARAVESDGETRLSDIIRAVVMSEHFIPDAEASAPMGDE